jgi:transposase
MPCIPTGAPATPEERQKTRRDRAAAKAQAPTVRVEHKVPDAERRCTVCGNAKLDPLGDGKRTTVWEFVPARFLCVEHVQEVLRCRCNGFVITAPGAPKVVEKGQYGASFLAHLAVSKCADHTPIYSRYLYLEFTVSQSFGSLVRCRDRCLRFFGGTSEVDIFDNMKTVARSHTPAATVSWSVGAGGGDAGAGGRTGARPGCFRSSALRRRMVRAESPPTVRAIFSPDSPRWARRWSSRSRAALRSIRRLDMILRRGWLLFFDRLIWRPIKTARIRESSGLILLNEVGYVPLINCVLGSGAVVGIDALARE